ncbi:MAG: hypothetical protein GY898_32340 [Proteobacteria bacterium]|nr:hypothetical protein [Pseudomonadota bacterium]
MGRLPTLVGLLLAAATAWPMVRGDGIDVPDDALYYAAASWEWLARAWSEGISPWFVPGKLGGVSLFGDAVPMGPFYPASWLLHVLPASVAFPAACVLHGLLAFVAVRWMARTFGASEGAAALAGAAVAVGPLGALGFVDCRSDAWPMIVWFPVALGAMERCRTADGTRARLGWTALAGAAVGLVLLGCHVRLGIATTAAFGVWGLLCGAPLQFAVLAGVLGIAAGAPQWVPTILEWGEASASASAGSRLDGLAAPVEAGLSLPGLPGFLAPRPWVSYADYSLGAVLGVVLILAIGRGPLRIGLGRDVPPAGRLALFFVLMAGASFSPSIPGLRYVFAPLLVLSHPVNDVWSALAILTGAGAAAAALDGVVAMDVDTVRGRLKGFRGVLIAGLLGGGGTLAFVGAFRDADSRQLYALGLVQGVVSAGLVVALVARRNRPAMLMAVLVGLGMADLGGQMLRIHTAVPSAPLGLTDRTDVDGVEALGAGFVDIDDLARLEGFAYEEGGSGADDPQDEPEEFWEDTAAMMQEQILHRRWPPHLGMDRGYRGLSGRAKLPPGRQIQALTPLAEMLRVRNQAPDALEELFTDGGLGVRTMQLHGIAAAAAADGTVWTVDGGLPLCRIPTRLERDEDPRSRIGRLLEDRDFVLGGPIVLVETQADEGLVGTGELVSCADGEAEVRSEQGTVLVVRQRLHGGWSFASDVPLGEPFPVDQVHTGVRVPAGTHTVRWRFDPPGLNRASAVAWAAWGLLAVLGVAGLRRAGASAVGP